MLCSLPDPPHPKSQSIRQMPCSGGKRCLQWQSLEQLDLSFIILILSRGILKDWSKDTGDCSVTLT